MLPTYMPGRKVVVQKTWFFTRIMPGDVVVAKDPRNGRLILKRVQHINSKGQLFLLGDNKEESTDSRTFGFIARKNAIGKVIGR